MSLKHRFENYTQLFSNRLSNVDALPQLAILGLLSGIATAVIILIFRFCIEFPLSFFLPNGDPENFEGLSGSLRALLPLSAASILAITWYKIKPPNRKVGVSLVMERLNYHQGYISGRSFFAQFCAGVVSIIGGLSSGREGPAVHLGAACSSLLGQKMRLPNNSIRTLVACGTAAAISASFNTPIAGVIFAMEVVMMEYTVVGFTPVVISSVSAAVLSHAVYGAETAFLVPHLFLNSLLEIPYIILCGFLIGAIGAAFVFITTFFMRFSSLNIFYRILIAGLITAAIASVFPQIMGIGYDTVNLSLNNTVSVWLFIAIAVAKLFATSISAGLGMPIGVIGPTLFIGATFGAAMGVIAQHLMPEIASTPGLYAMLGMGAMMGAVLQAPLSALMAILELTSNHNFIVPGMLMIVTAHLVANTLFKQKSLFLSVLEKQGLNYNANPTLQALRRSSVESVMDRKFAQTGRFLALSEAKELLRLSPTWLIIEDDNQIPVSLSPAVDLVHFLETLKDGDEPAHIDLIEMPAQRRNAFALYNQATLQEALDHFADKQCDVLYVERRGSTISRIIGVVARTDVENHYKYKKV
jgi:CIC family chloride channel protein